jgi:hypothetical protein
VTPAILTVEECAVLERAITEDYPSYYIVPRALATIAALRADLAEREGELMETRELAAVLGSGCDAYEAQNTEMRVLGRALTMAVTSVTKDRDAAIRRAEIAEARGDRLVEALREAKSEIEYAHANMLEPEERAHSRGSGWARVHDKISAALALAVAGKETK